ncbi:MAG TPA: lysylphosphatidylglycerol synthase domain-containing protein, partial [Casimicrobiaceae bacterium]|nr:lysylphosphatidylglycerol synthase domain-containing protein [Casimicrobiaceae bacterium]
PGWSVGVSGLQVVGLVCLAATVAYVIACAIAHDRVWIVRGHEIRLPRIGLAVLQLLVSAANWMVMAMLLYLLLHRQVEFSTMLGVLLVAAIAGAIAHIPAGLGVLELVTFAVLGHRLPEAELLAALLTYRAIYYIAPLLIALVMYLRFEAIAGARLLREA